VEDDRIVTGSVSMWLSSWNAVRVIAPNNVSAAIDALVRAGTSMTPKKHPPEGRRPKTPAIVRQMPQDATPPPASPPMPVPAPERVCEGCLTPIPTGAQVVEDVDGRPFCAQCAPRVP